LETVVTINNVLLAIFCTAKMKVVEADRTLVRAVAPTVE